MFQVTLLEMFRSCRLLCHVKERERKVGGLARKVAALVPNIECCLARGGWNGEHNEVQHVDEWLHSLLVHIIVVSLCD